VNQRGAGPSTCRNRAPAHAARHAPQATRAGILPAPHQAMEK
jgi:hypothetical protein